MRNMVRFVTIMLVCAVPALAAINVPSDGSDGALHITQNTEIDLSQAVTGSWNANNAANAGNGIYDPEKWAVVFKYSSVTVEAGATVTFKNHPSRAPVVWLVSGDVTINGTVSVNGQDHVATPAFAEPGPGGFRGGAGRFSGVWDRGAGLGPGGGSSSGTGGSYAYGNASLLPLIGGSGGGGGSGGSSADMRSGGGGGGAILVACGGAMSIGGLITANGGHGSVYLSTSSPSHSRSPGGSGGGIRLVADALTGNGNIQANGGSGSSVGGVGRIRLEQTSADSSLIVTPSPSVVALEPNATPLIWLPSDGPTVRIVSVNGSAAPADPRARLGILTEDVELPQITSSQVVIETVNVEEVATVQLRVTPRGNANYTTVNATVQEVTNPDPLTIRWVANAPLNAGSSALQVRVVRP